MKNRGINMLILGLFLALAATGNAQHESVAGNEVSGIEKVEVYYFHFERRCATCMAVENESAKALQELYPEQMKKGQVSFHSVNLEDATNDELAEKYGVDGQTLLVVRGDKQENLTNTAFMHARSDPGKLKEAIRESIGDL